MGYESRFYIVEKTSMKDGDMHWGDVVASYNLSKCYAVSDKLSKYPATDCYIYGDDGNTQIIEDCYGDPLKEIPIGDLITIVSEAMESSGSYRRFQPLLSLLKGFNLEEWRDLVVLHYGY